MDENLKQLIQIAGAALEAEDRFFLGAITANQIAYPGEKGGILRINNERYYQFVVARALASSFPYSAAVEVNSHDLILRYPNDSSKWLAVVEMKRWMSASGEQELTSIVHDINEKLMPSKAEHALMMIFSANPVNEIKTNLKWLSDKLKKNGSSIEIKPEGWESYKFATLNNEGDEVEFWVAGYQLK